MNTLLNQKLVFLALILLFSTNVLLAQVMRCGTASPTAEQIDHTINKMAKIPITKNAGKTGVALKAHVVLNGSGGGGPSLEDLAIGLANLNTIYDEAGIEFYYKEMPSYVSSATYYEFDETSGDTETGLKALFTTATNAVNIYFVNSIVTSSGFNAAGYAYYPSNTANSNVVLMINSVAAGDPNGTFSHEFGHFFNLYHTHEGTEDGNTDFYAENVPRSGGNANCSTKGDLLCDTQADPRFSGANFNYGSCAIPTPGVDENGATYSAPINNIMSYYPDICGGVFTDDQYTRIAQGLSTRLGHSTYTIQAIPQAVNPPTGLTGVFDEVSGGIDLTWNDVANNEMGYLIERSSTSSNSDFEVVVDGGVGANETSFTDMSIDPSTTYWYRVKPINGNKDTYSAPEQIESGLVFCVAGTSVCDEYVQRVVIGSIDNISNCTTGYQSYSNLSTDVEIGTSSLITITNGSTSWGTDQCGIFVDWNHDGDFDDSNETISGITNSPGVGPYSANITPPAGADLGQTRMRIRIVYGETPTDCGNEDYGEVEDYSLNVTAVLPIQLASFKGRSEKSKIDLSWRTEVELNNKSFEIERWNSSRQQFDYIGSLAGAGTTQIEQWYDFSDYHPRKGANLYRLKQIDFDGEFTCSDVISVEWVGEESLSLYPNPASDQLNINIVNPIDEKLSYSILNTLGQFQGGSQVLMDNANLEVDISQLPAGIYYLKLESAKLGIIGEWFTKL